MKKIAQFTFMTLWILLSRSYDVYATYQYTPDLSHEANPLVVYGGMGWNSIIPLFLVIIVLVLVAYYRSLFGRFNPLPTEPGLSNKEIATYVYLGRKSKWSYLFYRIPTSFRRFEYVMGQLLTYCLAAVGVVSTIMWLLINHTSWYLKSYHNTKVIYGMLVVACLTTMIWWYRQQIDAYRRSIRLLES